MLIAHGINAKLQICDIETLAEVTDIGCFDPDTGKWLEFQMSEYQNDLFTFVKWYTSKPCDYLVTYNGIGFDQQVLQYIVDNHQNWYELDGKQVAEKVYEYTQNLIENQRFKLPFDYKDYQFPIKPLDLFRIHHFDNEAKRTSLKWCAFMMNMDVEEMPIHHSTKGLSREDIETVINYRRNDCIVTRGLLYLTLGQVDKIEELNGGYTVEELKDYKGKNKIQDRFDVMKETGMDCLNWSDVKIGEEWNKADYKEAEKIKDDKELFSKKIKHPYGQRFKKFFPTTMSFKTEKLRKFIEEEVGNTYVLSSKQEFPITIGSTTYTIAKGGLHSTESHRRVIPTDGYILRDADVGSQYPNSIVKLRVYAPHLKPTILEQFKGKITKRFLYKDTGNALIKSGKAEEARPYMSVQEMLKLCLNGGYYGKLGQPGSFLEYPEGLLKVCMANQIEILMLVEMMEEAGFQVLSGNTDGIVVMFPENKEDLYNEICKEWEEKVGNHDMGKLEYTDFRALWQESINHYIAHKINKSKDGKITYSVKKKGRFMTEYDMHKNKSKRIIALALEAYFINGENPANFIRNHKNIYDFCIAKKAFGKLHYEELIGHEDVNEFKHEETEVITHKKLIRYFVSNSGNVFMKRGYNNTGDPVNNHVEAITKEYPWMGQPLLKYFNKGYRVDDFSKYDINYNYYILETLSRIDAIEKTKKAKQFADQFKTKQTSLF